MSVENQIYENALSHLQRTIGAGFLRQISSSRYGKSYGYPPEYIARGVDSTVFRVNDLAIKPYRETYEEDPLYVKQLNLYKRVTNYYANFTQGRTQKINCRGIEYSVIVNPILFLGYVDLFACHVGISPFIEGSQVDTSTIVHLDKLIAKWMKNSKLTGFGSSSVNFKFPANMPETIVVTDLCSSIDLLRV